MTVIWRRRHGVITLKVHSYLSHVSCDIIENDRRNIDKSRDIYRANFKDNKKQLQQNN